MVPGEYCVTFASKTLSETKVPSSFSISSFPNRNPQDLTLTEEDTSHLKTHPYEVPSAVRFTNEGITKPSGSGSLWQDTIANGKTSRRSTDSADKMDTSFFTTSFSFNGKNTHKLRNTPSLHLRNAPIPPIPRLQFPLNLPSHCISPIYPYLWLHIPPHKPLAKKWQSTTLFKETNSSDRI